MEARYTLRTNLISIYKYFLSLLPLIIVMSCTKCKNVSDGKPIKLPLNLLYSVATRFSKKMEADEGERIEYSAKSLEKIL